MSSEVTLQREFTTEKGEESPLRFLEWQKDQRWMGDSKDRITLWKLMQMSFYISINLKHSFAYIIILNYVAALSVKKSSFSEGESWTFWKMKAGW